MANVVLGADPELFFHVDGIIQSVNHFLPGCKSEPFSIGNGEYIQPDGLAGEFNVKPTNNAKEFSDSIDRCIKAIVSYLPEDYQISTAASNIFTPEQMKEVERLNPDALKLGCAPDYCAMTGVANPAPILPVEGLRSAGGHVSIDIPQVGNVEDMCRFVTLACDVYLGLPSLAECSDTRRREIYGKAGAYRPYAKFVEYRTLSNYWIFDVKHRQAVFNRAQKAAKFADEEMFDALFNVVDMVDVAEVINSGNVEAAKEMMELIEANGL